MTKSRIFLGIALSTSFVTLSQAQSDQVRLTGANKDGTAGITTPAKMTVRGLRSGGSQPTTTLSAPTGREASANAVKEELEAEIADQQRQIEQLRSALEEQKKLLERTLKAGADASTSSFPIQVSGGNEVATAMVPSSPTTSEMSSTPQEKTGAEEVSPLQLRIGSAFITPVGFVDFTSVYRSHDGGSGIGTNFAGIPYGNVMGNNLSEFRFSMQNSRIGFRVDAMVKGAHVIGYMESDFLGNDPGNVAVSSNSNTLRSRLYWIDVQKGKWEVLGGQTWSLITPGRSGISPLPGNLFIAQNIDVNYQLGFVWGRIPELRFVFHPSNKAALAVALDSPEQYVGGSAGGGLVTFPTALNAYPGGELNSGGNTLAVPNVAPDVIAKLAFDPSSKFHVEVGGLERQFKVWNPNTGVTFSKTGGGGFLNLNVQLFQGFRLLTNNFWSDGGGRYIFGQAPDLIARANGSISPIHTGSPVSGFEYTHKNTLLYSYYGGLYVQRNVTVDANGTTPIGYGYVGSPPGQNRAVQQITFGTSQNFWRDAKYGALTLMSQYSYLVRNPWFIAAGAPRNANLNMVFLNLRYTLPGSAPAIK